MTGNNIVPADKTIQESAVTKEEVLEELPEEVSEIIDKLPPDDRKTITKSFQLMMGSFSPSPMAPIIKKLTPEHLTKIIDYSENEDKRYYKFASWARVYFTIYVVLAIALFIFLTVYLSKDKTDLYMKIIEVIVIFGGGFGLGVGYKNSKKQ